MRLQELINATLRECVRISANVRDCTIFYWPFCSGRIKSHRSSRQDVCCTGTGKPVTIQHCPLLTFGSTASCSARLTVAAAMTNGEAPKGGASTVELEQRARRRGKPIEVWVTDEEKAEIDARANSAGLSRSAYMRAAGLNHRVGAIADLDAVRDLVKVNADFGRLAGLLKLWLAEKRGQGARPFDVEALMMQFRELQHQTRAIMSRVVFKKK